ncbi:MAG: zinc-ribbon domain-containing protein [Firmicutes bacterium]|nr:zinc-ribbon domain-containing protein [Bacillota bacterium]
MAYCGKCGNQVEEGDSFCSSCGTRVTNGSASQSQLGGPYPQINLSASPASKPAENMQTAAKQVLHFQIALAALFGLALTMGDILGLILSGGMIALLHFGAYKTLLSGSKGNAGNVVIGCTFAAATIGLLVLVIIRGTPFIGMLDLAAAAFGYKAWRAIDKI